MGFSVKSKFAGLLRGLLRQVDSREPSRPVSGAVPPVLVAAPPMAPPPPAPPPAKFSTPSANPNEIEIALAPVIAALPMELRAKLMSVPAVGATLRLPAEMVVSQLAFGAVKISFGELRQLAPGIFANTGGEQDNRPIALPLNEILSRINPTLLSRRSAQKIEVAEDIAGPFAERGRGFSFTSQPLKAPFVPSPPPPVPEPAKPIAFTPPIPPRQVAPPPMTPPIPPRAVTLATNGTGHTLPHAPIVPRHSPPPATNGKNGNGHSHSFALPPGMKLPSSNGKNGTAPPPPNNFAAPVPGPIPHSPRPEPVQPTIFAPLAALSEHWPAELKQEFASFANVAVPLPGSIIEPGLKRGRVAMTWKQLRTLAQPGSAVSPNDNLELELPLKVIAPLFLAAQKNQARPQSKTSVSGEIPDLFFGFPQPAPAAAAPAAPMVPTLSKPMEPRTADTNYYSVGEKGQAPQADEVGLRRVENVQTDFMSRQAHPKDVVARAAFLPGVAGAVVAMQDGLRVASQVPVDLNADTLAAFLPQIFDRVNQSTRELRMGALNNVSFTVGNIPWKIFKVNSVYFAAFGRAGEGLPTSPLAQLAAELDRKKQ